MFSKLLLLTALVASSVAAPLEHHEATSFAHFNDNHNAIHHIQSAAPQAYYHKQPTPQVYHAAPVPQSIYHAPAPQAHHVPAPQVYHTPAPQVYHAPAPQVYNAPQPQVHHAQAPQVYYSGTVATGKVSLPLAKVAHYATPVAKVVAPVAHYSSASSYNQHKYEEQYPDAHPKYEYTYSIEDGHTGDYHSQQEQRDGDHVVGQYYLHEADGTVRIVKYSDEGHGFNAIVERQGHPTQAPQQYKKVAAAAQYEHQY